MAQDLFYNPSLDARLFGISVMVAPSGTSEHYFSFPFDCKFNGIEIKTNASELGDKLSLETQYNAGPYGWKRYKRFAKQWNVFPDESTRVLLFPTEPKAGIRVKVTYENAHQTDIKIAINLFTFVDSEIVNAAQLQEGADW